MACICQKKALPLRLQRFNNKQLTIMNQFGYTVDELRASVEEGTRQVENGQYYTDAQVTNMLEQRLLQLA